MKFIKHALLAVIFIFALTAVSLWAVTYWIKPDTVKIIAQKKLSTLTHQTSVIDGTVNWRIFPRPGLHVTHVRIGDVNQTDAAYALAVEHLFFNVEIIPLFRGQLIFDQLVLDGFKLKLNIDETPSAIAQKQKFLQKKQHRAHPSRIALNSLLLTNGQIMLTHDKTQHAIFDHVRLEAWFPQSKHDQVPIQFKASLIHNSQTLPLQTDLNYKGLIRLAPHSEETSNTLMNNLELDGQLTLLNGIFKQYKFTQANAHLVFNHKKIQLNPLTISLYNGESIGQLSYQLDSKQFEFNQTGTTLNAEPVFQSLLGEAPPHITGALDFSIHASADLNQPSWFKKSKLNGSLTLRDGILTYVSLKTITQEATQTIRGLATQNLKVIQETLEHLKPWNMADYAGNTPFELINVQYKINKGGFLLYSLLLETKKLHLKGQGNLNIETNDVDANLTANISTYDPTLIAMQQLLMQGFPLKISGKIDDLAIHIDRSAIRNLLSNGLLPNQLTKPIKLIGHHLKQFKHDARYSEDIISD